MSTEELFTLCDKKINVQLNINPAYMEEISPHIKEGNQIDFLNLLEEDIKIATKCTKLLTEAGRRGWKEKIQHSFLTKSFKDYTKLTNNRSFIYQGNIISKMPSVLYKSDKLDLDGQIISSNIGFTLKYTTSEGGAQTHAYEEMEHYLRHCPQKSTNITQSILVIGVSGDFWLKENPDHFTLSNKISSFNSLQRIIDQTNLNAYIIDIEKFYNFATLHPETINPRQLLENFHANKE